MAQAPWPSSSWPHSSTFSILDRAQFSCESLVKLTYFGVVKFQSSIFSLFLYFSFGTFSIWLTSIKLNHLKRTSLIDDLRDLSILASWLRSLLIRGLTRCIWSVFKNIYGLQFYVFENFSKMEFHDVVRKSESLHCLRAFEIHPFGTFIAMNGSLTIKLKILALFHKKS